MNAHFNLVTDADLARARGDAGYRRALLTQALDSLVSVLNRHRRADDGSARVRGQLREGGLLAVRLAEMIARLEPPRVQGGQPPF